MHCPICASRRREWTAEGEYVPCLPAGEVAWQKEGQRAYCGGQVYLPEVLHCEGRPEGHSAEHGGERKGSSGIVHVVYDERLVEQNRESRLEEALYFERAPLVGGCRSRLCSVYVTNEVNIEEQDRTESITEQLQRGRRVVAIQEG